MTQKKHACIGGETDREMDINLIWYSETFMSRTFAKTFIEDYLHSKVSALRSSLEVISGNYFLTLKATQMRSVQILFPVLVQTIELENKYLICDFT